MLEMVFLKADLWLAEYYDTRLVPENLWALGNSCVRACRLHRSGAETAPAGRPAGRSALDQESIKLRNPYTDPLNVLQAELLNRSRNHPETLHPSWIRR